MEITNAKYVTNNTTGEVVIQAVVYGTDVFVPTVPGNRYYDEMLRQIADGILVIEGEP